MKNLLFVLIFLISNATFAGRESNGGDGVRMNRQIYLLDLVEAGAHQNPYFADPGIIDQNIKNALLQIFDETKFPIDLLAIKLSEIKQHSIAIVYALLAGMKTLNWRIVPSELVDVEDEDTVLNIPRDRFVQLATRRDGVVRINESHWNGRQLSQEQKAALIFHEVIYAFLPYTAVQSANYNAAYQTCVFYYPRPRELYPCLERSGAYNYFQESSQARNIVGELFANEIVFEDLTTLGTMTTLHENSNNCILKDPNDYFSNLLCLKRTASYHNSSLNGVTWYSGQNPQAIVDFVCGDSWHYDRNSRHDLVSAFYVVYTEVGFDSARNRMYFLSHQPRGNYIDLNGEYRLMPSYDIQRNDLCGENKDQFVEFLVPRIQNLDLEIMKDLLGDSF